MKKNGLLLGMIFIVIASLCFCASAEDYLPEDGAGNHFTVTYTAGIAGNFYSLVVVEGDYTTSETAPAFTADNIIYLDQASAGENGFAVFSSFSPMRETTGTVYLGGTELEKPILLGRIICEKAEFVFDSSSSVVVEYNGNGGDIILPDGTTSIDENAFAGKGVTSIRVPSTATRVFEVIEGVDYYYSPDAAVDFSGVTLGTSYFIIGDFDNNGAVEGADLQSFLQKQAGKKDIIWNDIQGDVNYDGVTTLKDIFDLMKRLLVK